MKGLKDSLDWFDWHIRLWRISNSSWKPAPKIRQASLLWLLTTMRWRLFLCLVTWSTFRDLWGLLMVRKHDSTHQPKQQLRVCDSESYWISCWIWKMWHGVIKKRWSWKSHSKMDWVGWVELVCFCWVCGEVRTRQMFCLNSLFMLYICLWHSGVC